MLLLPLMLAACNPEHNPGDLAHIDKLEGDNARLSTNLTAERAETDSLQDQLTLAQTQLNAYTVVGRAYQTAVNMPGDELVVCYPVAPIAEDGTIAADPAAAPVRTQPWVQATVTTDCGEPDVLVLTTVYPDSADQMAAVGEGYDGPTISNAPDDEEDPE